MFLRRLNPADAEAFQTLRLYGLRASPTAFGSSYEEEVERPLHVIAQSLGEDSGRAMFGAFIDGQLVGIAGFRRETGIKQRHQGALRSMYVAPDFRKRGVARALITEVIRFAQSQDGLRQLTLTVTAGNQAAIAAYVHAGFVAFGIAPQALQVDGEFFDEVYMVKHFHPV
jgi:RimJ/RimL family protein N-acetyltransferase